MKKKYFLIIAVLVGISQGSMGQGWSLRKSFDLNTITCIQFGDTTKGYILGFETDFSGLALTTAKYTTNGGKDWKPSNLPFSDYVPFNNQRVESVDFLVGAGNNQDGVFGKSRDNGKTWGMTTLDFQILNLHFNDTLNGVVVGAFGNIYRTKDGGRNWDFITKALGDVYGIDKIKIFDKNILFICGTNGLIGSSKDSGLSWSFKYNSNMSNLKSIIFDQKGTAWVCNDAGQIYRSIDTCKTWILNYSNSFEDFGHFERDNQKRIWVCGDLGRLDLNIDTLWDSYSNMPGTHDMTFDYITDFVFTSNDIGWFCSNEGNLFSNSRIDTTNSTSLVKINNGNSYMLTLSKNMLSVKNFNSNILDISIHDCLGKLIAQFQIEGNTNIDRQLSKELCTGLYFITAVCSSKREVRKIIINN